MDYYTRLTCKCVCSRWLEILMTDFQFVADRTLDLRNCSIAQYIPPFQILQDTLYNYNGLILNEESINFEDFEDVREFWEAVGKVVTSVKYEGTWNSKLVIVLTAFDNLRTFETLEKEVLHGMSQLSTNFLSKAFGNVETLHIDSFQSEFGTVFLNLKTVVYGKGNLKYKARLTDDKSGSSLKVPTLVDDGSCTSKDIGIIEFEHRLQPDETFNNFSQFLKSHPSIKKTNLILNHVPREPIPTKVDSLSLEKMDTNILDYLTPSLKKRLKSLTLKKMHLRNLDSLSSATVFSNVEYLGVKLERRPNHCESGHCLGSEGPSQKFSLSYKFPSLKELNIDLKVLKRFCTSSDTPMTHVRKLIIRGEGRMISNFDWKRIFPNLRYLRIKLLSPFTETQQNMSEIFSNLKDLLPDLSYLRIIPEKSEEESEEEFSVAKYEVLTTAQNLKTLTLDYDFDSCTVRKTLVTYLFSQLCKLNVVKLGTNESFCFYRRDSLDLVDN